MVKKLYKSNYDKKIDGVCGGIAEYLKIDATLIRLIWVICSCMGWGVVAYIICAIIIPRDPGFTDTTDYHQGGNGNAN